jgi:hypothetical protein
MFAFEIDFLLTVKLSGSHAGPFGGCSTEFDSIEWNGVIVPYPFKLYMTGYP